MKRRRFVFSALTVIVVLLLLTYGVACWIGYDTASLPSTQFAPTTPEGDYEEVQFPSRGQNYMVHAFLQLGSLNAPALINVHGYQSSRYVQHMRDRAGMMNQLGYTVLTLDLSDSGGSTVDNGRISFGYSERWDVLGGFDFLLTRGFAPSQIGLVGISMGAASSLLAAAAEPRIRAVWEDSGYTNALTVLGEQAHTAGLPSFIVPGAAILGWLRTGDRVFEVNPIGEAATLKQNDQAIYDVHCQQDQIVDAHHGVDLYNAYKSAGVNVQFWQVGCVSHGEAFNYAPAEYSQRLDTFFKQYLAG
ncbi:MAG: prolyl oligopeptidase family serine peptidase [Anaerolineae bacterium]|nr:prolyl oligopeptidase family serine peptidase [Anaerolineae bacterium]